MKTKITFLYCCLLTSAFAQGTAFTYQGRLNDNGAPANGNYDLRFIIYDSSVGGSQQGTIVTNAVTAVSNGLFTVALDFGNQFPGAARWLEIAARTNGAGNFSTLSPRQPLTPAPYAVTAGNVAGGGTVAGNGGGLTNVNAITLGGLSPTRFWQLGGNSGVNPASDFLGTADSHPLQIRAPGGVGIGTAAPLAPLQIVSSNNSAPQLQLSQDMTNNFSRLRMNVTGSPFWEMDVSSGSLPYLSFWNAVQRVLFDYFGNVYALSFNGGGTNLTGLNAANVTSGALADARLSSNVALRSGGNTFTGNQSVIGGNVNVVSASSSPEFQITQTNTNDHTRLRMNVSGAPSWEMDVSPGATPLLEFWNSTLRMVLDYSGNLGIGTGSPDSPLNVVSGGTAPQLHADQSTSGNYARLRLSVNNGSLWDVAVRDNGSNPGWLQFFTESGAARVQFDRAGNVYALGTINGSDRNLKMNFQPVNTEDVLEKVTALPITRWNFKTDAGSRHIGPMAQDFYAAFGVGPDDKHIATVDEGGVALAAIQGLNQKLEASRANSDDRMQKLETENADLKQQNESLEKRLAALEQFIRNQAN